MSVGEQASLAKMTASPLLKSEVHARKEGAANERDFVDDEEDYSTPLFFKAPCGVSLKLFLPRSAPRDAEAGAAGFSLRSQC